MRTIFLLPVTVGLALGHSLAHAFVIPSGRLGGAAAANHLGRESQHQHENQMLSSTSAFTPSGGGSLLASHRPSPSRSVVGGAATTSMICNPLGPGQASATLGAASTMAVALLRGGATETNVLSGVLAELANVRTPAALLGGAALGTMFVGPKTGNNKRLYLLYTALSTSAFALQLVCVLCSTLTYTSVASQSEAIATSAISYLTSQTQFEFYVIRGSFMYGLFSFLGALMVRGWLTFSADGERGSAKAMMTILGGSCIFLLNFIHHTHNSLTMCLGGMTKRLFWLTLGNMYGTKTRLFRHIAGVAAIWGAVKLLKLGPNQGDEKLDITVKKSQ